MRMKARFRGYLPVVVDVETGGIDNAKHPVLEMAVRTLEFDEERLVIADRFRWSVIPHPRTVIDHESLKVTGIDLADPDRNALTEEAALRELFRTVRREIKRHECQRAILTGHNAHFDHGFIRAAAARSGVKRDPFHPFSVMDTVALAGVAYGHTVLGEACSRAGVGYDKALAHTAAYDAEVTARLFCAVVNGVGQIEHVSDPRPPARKAGPGVT